MSYQVTFTKAASHQLASLPKQDQKRIRVRIDRLAIDPRPPGAKALQGKLGLLRIRVGNYRIVYKVEDDRLVVIVIRIGHRREVYHEL